MSYRVSDRYFKGLNWEFGDIWSYHSPHSNRWVVVTTNMYIKKDGRAVMGRGVAKQALTLFPLIDVYYGNLLQEQLKHIDEDDEDYYIGFGFDMVFGMVFLPVKRVWSDKADEYILELSLMRLRMFAKLRPDDIIYTPVPAIGFGEMSPKIVTDMMKKYLGGLDNIVVIRRDKTVKKKYRNSFRKAIRKDKS